MADMVNSAPAAAPAAPAPAAAPAPSSSGFKQPEGAHSAHDIFSEFEQKLGWKEEQGPDFSDAREWKDGNIEEMIENYGKEEVDPTTGETPDREPQVDMDGNPAETQQTEEDSDKFEYDFEDEIGGKQHKIQFKSKEQLNTAIKKAIVADRLYKQTKELKAEIESYTQDREFARNMDDYLENRPMELLDMVIEDLPEEDVKNWLLAKAEWYGQDQEVRRQAQIQKENELLRRKLAAIEESEQRIAESRRQAAMEADRHVVQAWGSGVLSKMKSRIPEQYHGMVEKELRSTLLEARHRQSQNENVDVKTLDKIFTRNMRPLLELIQEKASKRVVDSEVGRVLNEKKQQNLARVQSAASQAMSRGNQTPRMSKELEENPAKIFDYLIEGIDKGKYRLKG
jgi:hypothetical protein